MYTYNNAYGCTGYTTPSFSAESLSYWERSLFQRMRTLFVFEGLPNGGQNQVQTDKDAFLYGLFVRGFLAVFQTRQYGVTFQPATPTGYGLQGQPTGMQVATPYFSFARPLVINSECEVLKLTPDYTGIWDIVRKYARELQLVEVAIRQSSINARMAYVLAASNDKQAASLKAMMERVENADPYMIYNEGLKSSSKLNMGQPELPWAQWDRDLKKNFILPELLDARRTIITDFYREMGVPVPQDKKERVNKLETQTNMSEFFNRREIWRQCLEESTDRINRMYGLNLSAKFADEEVLQDAVQVTNSKLNQQ